MSNEFYDGDFGALPDVLIRATNLNNEFAAVAVGFDRVEVKTKAALRAPDGEQPLTIPARADRASKSLAFDASGNPVVAVAANSVEMQAAVDAAVTVAADAAQVATDRATLEGSVNTMHLLQILSGVR